MPGDKVIRYAAYFLGILVLVSFSYFRIFETFELQTLDLRFKLRPVLKVNSDIVIIEIAEDSIRELGKWPFDRGYHAALIDCLRQVGARAIVFDIFFSDKSPHDDELIGATQRAKGLIYYPIVFKLNEGRGKGYLKAEEIEAPLIDGLKADAKGVGHINIVTDADGKRRRIPLFIEYQGIKYPQLTYLVAADYLGKKSIKVPTDAEGTVLVNYAGKWTETFKHYSFADVLRSFYKTVEGEKTVLNLAEFSNKVCFIGAIAVGTYDLNSIPLEPRYPMVGVHANLFNSIVQNKFLSRANKIINLAILVGLCVIIAIVVNKVRPLSGLGISLLIIFLFIVVGLLLFIILGLWIDLFYPVAVSFGVYLAATFNRYLVEQRKRLLMDQELAIAKKIQLDFLPQSVPQMEGVEIAASISTAKAVGGDLYDFADIKYDGERKLGIMIGDVSGKGTPAALFMARSIADFRHFAHNRALPSAVLNDLNAQIALNYKSDLFITMFYMIYDDLKKMLTFSNAGHLPAIWLKADGAIEFLKTEGMPLGLVDTEKYSDATVGLTSGDTIILYTDGVTEARNQNKEEFTSERLKEVISKNRHLSSQQMTDAIKSQLSRFVGTTPQYDDCTIVLIKIKE